MKKNKWKGREDSPEWENLRKLFLLETFHT